jgi:hypothetical protein
MNSRKTYWNVALVALAALAIAGTTVRADVNPVGWWTFDDGAGTTVTDSSTNANHGVVTGNAAWTTGRLGGALSFDGTDDYVTVPIGSIISGLTDTTITTWANFSNAGGAWQRLWDFGSGSGNSPYMFLCARVNTGGVIRFAIRTATIGEQVVNTPNKLPSGWHNVTVVMDSVDMMSRVYVDGEMVASGATLLLPKDLGATTQNWFGKSQWPDALYQGDLDDIRIYNRVLTQDEIKNVMAGGIGYGLANTPSPADEGTNLLPDVTLSWAAGQEAEAHDVYFGAAAEDVGAADAANPMGVLVSSGQSGTTFDAGRLEFGKTYFWRVDEVGPAPDFTVYKGNVWSFTVEPYAYTLGAASITAAASSVNDDTMGPEKTIDGSGLNAEGQHSIAETDMWLSSQDGPLPGWIQYEFDRVYLLNDMLVWNSNLEIESVVGYGVKDVKVEYSLDGVTWANLGNFEFAQAPGDPSYTSDIKVDFAGKAAKFVKLTIADNWGGIFDQYGLSEVRFSYIPVGPTNLSPVAGTLDLESPVTLSWRPGRQAVTHEIYLGTDPNDLPLAATVEEDAYVADVAMGNVYYWKVVEVNEAADPARWESDVASFSTVAIPKDPGDENLMHRYTFDDGTATDSAGEADGVLVGGAAVVDGALVISAQDQWMEMPGSVIAMNTYEAVSLVARYTPTAGANGGYTMLAYFGDSVGGLGSNGFFFSPARGDNVSRAAISIGNTSAPWAAESGANGPEYDDGKTHFVVVTLDATTIKLYLEGELVASTPLSETNKIGGISQNLAHLGKGGYTNDPEWIGAIHEFRIYNKALSAGEVVFLTQAQPKDPGADALTHLYTFDDGTANDSAGGADGTPVGGAAIVDGSLVTTAQDQWMEMPGDVIAMNTYEAMSVAAWFTPKAGANTGYHMLCYFGDSLNGFGSNGFFYTPARGNNVSRAGISCGNAAAPWAAETGIDGLEIDDGQPHFIVVTIDATTLTYYLDGVFAGSAALSEANKLSNLSTNFAYLAKGGYSADPEWIGAIHEFRIYNKALSVGEANYLFGQR